MAYLIIGIALLGCLLLMARMLVNADPAKLSRVVGWFAAGLGVAGASALVIGLIASDRLGPALAVAGGLAPLVLRGRTLWRRYHGGASTAGGKISEVETELLRMKLDHDTGAMSGQVRRGPYAGRRVEDLDQGELIVLWRQCIAEDEAGARLLESYLDRLRPDWRQAAPGGSGSGGGAGAQGDVMTREQAYAILDLEPGASDEQIKDAHRRLMMKLHPDHGGSTFLAAQINRAKEFLLGE
jgi:DnaJ-domain-containing protein 1